MSNTQMSNATVEKLFMFTLRRRDDLLLPLLPHLSLERLEVVQRRPLEGRDRGELPRHSPQRVKVLQVPQLERSTRERHDEVL